jgi:ABC transporter DrrB family efflux protein
MPVGYAQWVLPGILGMNMMFSALYGVGYVLVRYRKNGVLKRLKATPLSALEFMAAQVASRLMIIITVTLVLFVGCVWLLDLTVEGAYLDLLLLTLLGIIALISLGVLITSVTRSEELAGGLVNLVSWPMMLLSGVWFSLEGAPELLQWVARCLPLTHWIEGARAIMIEGASLAGIAGNLWVLALMSLLFMSIGAWRFNWGE